MEIVVGLHVPEIPFVEVGGKIGAVPLTQIGFIAVKVGVVIDVIETDIVASVAQVLLIGEKVYKVVCAVFGAGDHEP